MDCDCLHGLSSFQVFSAFGFVHKIATFEKAAGFQVRNCSLIWLNSVYFFISFNFPQRYIVICMGYTSGIDSIHWCWYCIFSKECLGWEKYTQVCNHSFNCWVHENFISYDSYHSICIEFSLSICLLVLICLLFYCVKKNFRYLLPDHVGSCHLRISYSAHKDLNIKFQSHRSRWTRKSYDVLLL